MENRKAHSVLNTFDFHIRNMKLTGIMVRDFNSRDVGWIGGRRKGENRNEKYT